MVAIIEISLYCSKSRKIPSFYLLLEKKPQQHIFSYNSPLLFQQALCRVCTKTIILWLSVTVALQQTIECTIAYHRLADSLVIKQTMLLLDELLNNHIIIKPYHQHPIYSLGSAQQASHAYLKMFDGILQWVNFSEPSVAVSLVKYHIFLRDFKAKIKLAPIDIKAEMKVGLGKSYFFHNKLFQVIFFNIEHLY